MSVARVVCLQKIFSVIFLLNIFFFPLKIHANAIAVTNISLANQDGEAETIDVEFDISWENSWRGSVNYDAAWVFVKYSTDSGVTWSHATLKTSDTSTGYDKNATQLGYSRGTGTLLDIVVPDDNTTSAGGGYGAFLYRSYPGTGTVDTDDIDLVWDWAADGLTSTTQARVKVFAIEMVYIPEGPFYIGDGTSTLESLFAFHQDGVDNNPVQITTSAKNIDADAIMDRSILVDGDGGIDKDGTSAVDNANWPTGYKSFYLMKYEISQGAFRDFLNTLTLTQQQTRTNASLSGNDAGDHVMIDESAAMVYRQTIIAESDPGSGPYTFGCDFSGDNTADGSSDGEWIAMNYMSWMDLCAYMDWAGLRPFTELEFEKACRGPNEAVYGEYAWGTTNITQATTLSSSATVSETVTQSGKGLCAYDMGITGPLRSGFAAKSGTSRLTSGAGYYGAMALSGNAPEQCVTLGNSTGRLFQGSHGDGVLSAAGNATNSDWPGYSSGEVTAGTGSGIRGGYYSVIDDFAMVSYRNLAASPAAARAYMYGGRCARSSSED